MLLAAGLLILLHLLVTHGLDPGAVTHTDVYARPGSDVLLPVTYNLTRHVDTSRCDTFTWSRGGSAGGSVGVRIIKCKCCEMPGLNFTRFPNYNVSEDGRLSISNVTKNSSGNYRFTVHSSGGVLKHNHSYSLHVEDPVSRPLLNVLCLLDGGAVIVCSIDSGKDPRFSISVNGRLLLENATLSTAMMNAREVYFLVTSTGPWNITCFVRNRVSDRETVKSQVKCADFHYEKSVLRGHLIFHGAVCVLYSLLLLCILRDHWKMKKRS